MKKWYLIKQDFNDLIYCVSNEKPEDYSLFEYREFLEFSHQLFIKQYKEFIKTLNSFKYILLDCETGEFTIPEEKCETFTFDELYEYNQEEVDMSIEEKLEAKLNIAYDKVEKLKEKL